jgi:hypothetical protein
MVVWTHFILREGSLRLAISFRSVLALTGQPAALPQCRNTSPFTQGSAFPVERQPQMLAQEVKFTANHMNQRITSTPTRRKLPLIIGIIIFGILMGIREDFASGWQRALVAATAAVVLGLSAVQYRTSSRSLQ